MSGLEPPTLRGGCGRSGLRTLSALLLLAAVAQVAAAQHRVLVTTGTVAWRDARWVNSRALTLATTVWRTRTPGRSFVDLRYFHAATRDRPDHPNGPILAGECSGKGCSRTTADFHGLALAGIAPLVRARRLSVNLRLEFGGVVSRSRHFDDVGQQLDGPRTVLYGRGGGVDLEWAPARWRGLGVVAQWSATEVRRIAGSASDQILDLSGTEFQRLDVGVAWRRAPRAK